MMITASKADVIPQERTAQVYKVARYRRQGLKADLPRAKCEGLRKAAFIEKKLDGCKLWGYHYFQAVYSKPCGTVPSIIYLWRSFL
jgi:hypothetical protein